MRPRDTTPASPAARPVPPVHRPTVPHQLARLENALDGLKVRVDYFLGTLAPVVNPEPLDGCVPVPRQYEGEPMAPLAASLGDLTHLVEAIEFRIAEMANRVDL